MSKIPILKQQIFENMKGKEDFAKYIWECVIEPQMSYSFSINHSLPYSFVGIEGIILAIDFPTVFWNTANLIVDSGGMDDTTPDEDDEEIVSIYEPEDWEGYEYEDLPDRSGKKKKKVKTVDYGKIATAIGRFKNFGITVAPPNINSSSFTFTPVVETNTILYGLRGIARISTDLVNEIISKRPFSSMADFLSRININRLSMVNLIKCGAFDEIENKTREEIMDNYIASVSDHKDKLTLQNMNEIIQRELIPENMSYLKTLYNFNKVLKTHKTETYYIPGDQGIDFLVKHGCADDLIDGEKIPCKVWDKKYAKAMTPLKDYLKEHSDELVKELNATYFAETKKKYASGNISKWEMESLSFYSHPHELAAARRHFTNFFKLPEEPAIEKTFESKDGKSIPIYALTTIAGTVINRDKMKHTITLLTVDGVVNVKIYKSQFAVYDRQLSFIKKDGTKVVVEKSWFTRGNLLMIQGFRRGQDFVPKAYKNSPNPALTKINGIDEFGNIDYQKERLEVGDEE